VNVFHPDFASGLVQWRALRHHGPHAKVCNANGSLWTFFFLKLSEVEVNDWLKVMNSHQNLGILRSVNNYGNSPYTLYVNGRDKLPIDSYGPEVLPLLPITLKMP
jgi:hypothetical protein